MCGIILGIDRTEKAPKVNDWIIDQYEEQFSRGTKGFGIIDISPDNKVKVVRATEPVKFMLDIRDNPSQAMIIHHRTPTSTDNKLRQTHPMVVDNGSLKYKYLVVHNGVIYNEDEVKLSHEALGFCYTTDHEDKFNDSETLAIELARYIEEQSGTIMARGSMAFIAVQVNKKTNKAVQIFFGRKTNPLNLAKMRGKIYLSSEGKGEPIAEEILYSFKLDKEMKFKKRKLVIAEFVPTPTPVTTSSKGYKPKPYNTFKSLGYNDIRRDCYTGFERDEDGREADASDSMEIYDKIEEKADRISELADEYRDAVWNLTAEDVDVDAYISAMAKEMKEMKSQAEMMFFSPESNMPARDGQDEDSDVPV